MKGGSDLIWNHIGVVGRRLDGLFTAERAFDWFCRPNEALGNRTPAELVVEGRTEEVLALIDKMEAEKS